MHNWPIIMTILCTILVGQNAQADMGGYTATLTIRAPASIHEVIPLSMGVISQPSFGSGNYSLSPSGVSSSDVEGGIIGGQQTGHFRFSGDANTLVSVQATPSACTDTNISLNQLSLSKDVITLSGDGVGDLNVGLAVSVASGITPGAYSCAYTVEFMYQ